MGSNSVEYKTCVNYIVLNTAWFSGDSVLGIFCHFVLNLVPGYLYLQLELNWQIHQRRPDPPETPRNKSHLPGWGGGRRATGGTNWIVALFQVFRFYIPKQTGSHKRKLIFAPAQVCSGVSTDCHDKENRGNNSNQKLDLVCLALYSALLGCLDWQ